jgi:hypothetical protein
MLDNRRALNSSVTVGMCGTDLESRISIGWLVGRCTSQGSSRVLALSLFVFAFKSLKEGLVHQDSTTARNTARTLHAVDALRPPMKLADDALTAICSPMLSRAWLSWAGEDTLASINVRLVIGVIKFELVCQRIAVEGEARSIGHGVPNATCEAHCSDTARVVVPTALFGIAFMAMTLALLSCSICVIGLIGCHLIEHHLKAALRHVDSPLIFALFVFPALFFLRPLLMNSLRIFLLAPNPPLGCF